MRAFKKGRPFMDVEAEWVPENTFFNSKGELKKQPSELKSCRVFSEHFLYETVGKDDARFILGVAREYDHLIKVLGEDKVRELLEQPAK